MGGLVSARRPREESKADTRLQVCAACRTSACVATCARVATAHHLRARAGRDLKNAYSFDSIARVVRASDARDFDVDLKVDRQTLVEAAVAEAMLQPSSLRHTTCLRVRGKPCYFYSKYSTNLVVRATARYLSQRFRVTAPNRDRVVRSVIEAMSEATPFHVIRRDIKSFYETVPVAELHDRLLYDTALPSQVRAHLREYFSILPTGTTQGLPRGIGLTTILAELAMHEFDQKVRATPGVYRYFRYSDDILVFSIGDLTTTEAAISDALPSAMKFNAKKCCSRSYFPSGAVSHPQQFDYLGYSFSAPSHPPSKRGKPRECRVGISDVKITKLKTRIVLALQEYEKAPNDMLLLYRLRYLSGNFKIARPLRYYELRSKFTRSGIYFNYKRCGIHNGFSHTPSRRTELMSLDWFYQNLITSSRSRYLPTLRSKMSPPLYAQLKQISFSKGYSHIIFARVPRGMTTAVKSIWRDH
ncbi:antiviral reverse transcriptase Drt3a [Phenylobacterium sp.]|uniref:antiviral reverse transcriptase Drt3a n=1 Tax=Phenylobacterium sp. TaxID=1871053 RepID=UPI0039C9BA29